MKTIGIPIHDDCKHGCKEGKYQFPVQARLDDTVYHFQNTGKPYMLRICPKCNGASVIFNKED